MGLLLLSAFFVVFFNYEIRHSDLYQSTFYPEKFEQSRAAGAEMTAQLDALNHRKCAIQVQAIQDIVPIEVERDQLFGIPKTEAEQAANASLEKDRAACAKIGMILSD